jgi:hypothetical protein
VEHVHPALTSKSQEDGEGMLAYIDGGTGGMMLQVLLGGLAGVALIVKASLSGIFGRHHDEGEDENQPADTDAKLS